MSDQDWDVVVIGAGNAAGCAALAAREHGATVAMLECAPEDEAGGNTRFTAGAMRVVYDGVGKETFDESLECLGRNGLMASFGNASGAVEPFSILRLIPKGLYLARPSMSSEIIPGEGLREAAAELFSAVADGVVTPTIGTRFPLAEVADAHMTLE